MDLPKVGSGGQPKASCQWRQMGHEEIVGLIQAEMSRMKQLPAVSAYATHRLRVLNKVLQLLTQSQIKQLPAVSIYGFEESVAAFDHQVSQVRNPAENEELELLFAGLSI